MFLDKGQGKSDFLRKKEENKKRKLEKEEGRATSLKIQKNVRAFLSRHRLIAVAKQHRDVRLPLLLQTTLDGFATQQVEAFVGQLQDSKQQKVYFPKIVLTGLADERFTQLSHQILKERVDQQFKKRLFGKSSFTKLLKKKLLAKTASQMLDISVRYLREQGQLVLLPTALLFGQLLRQFHPNYVDVEEYCSKLQSETIDVLLTHFASQYYYQPSIEQGSLQEISGLTNYYLSNSTGQFDLQREKNICYIIRILVRKTIAQYKQVISEAAANYKSLALLIQDDEQIEYYENKVKQTELVDSFSNRMAVQIQSVLTHPVIVDLFRSKDKHTETLRDTIFYVAAELVSNFDDRRMIFLRTLLASDEMLRSSNNPLFFEGLKLRMSAMDDLEFEEMSIFSQQEWTNLVRTSILKAYELAKKIVIRNNSQQKPMQRVAFERRDDEERQLTILTDLLNNIYKKALRTKKFDVSCFVNTALTSMLAMFNFGMGAKSLQILLQRLPFVFSFEARLNKLRQFIKEDKKKHDRSLFLQEEVDEDLIIRVRRGHEFLDAFAFCMHHDLRKKYKIVFYNEQGLKEEGIDGGGILKEFINRTLKSSFSDIYGMFVETSNHESLPNPGCKLCDEYEFVGRIIGKAVYEGINIEQKFAEPFINLVIGRQNTFEDMQYVDPIIYNNLLKIKHLEEDVRNFELTFTIFDTLPDGARQSVNLLCPSRPSKEEEEVYVTNQNKLNFILSYSDYKCNKQIQDKVRPFKRGFIKIVQPEWLTMFSNQEFNLIISGDHPDYSVSELRQHTVYNGYHEKDETVADFWSVLAEFEVSQKASFLLFVTSCSRPPTLGFAHLKPKLCISLQTDPLRLPTANTCMNALRLPNYKNKDVLRHKLLMAINAKAGFELG